MLNNFDSQIKMKTAPQKASKQPKLSLNLHTMPQTISNNWMKWLVLGLVILSFFAIASLIFYSFMP